MSAPQPISYSQARIGTRSVLALGLGCWLLGFGISLDAQITREEALAAVYPGAAIRAEQVFLTPSQQKQVLSQADADVASALVARYIATRDGKVVGRAYVDTHIVRTKKESLLVSLDQNGEVVRVDVTAFFEPAEYQASDAWLRQYRGRTLTDDVAINRAIRPIAGAALTARAANDAVRRPPAMDAVLQRTGGAP